MTVIPLRPHGGQGTDPPAVQSPRRLTDTEAMRLRAALRNLRALYGSWACLAAAMGVKVKTLTTFVSSTSRGASPGIALAAARAAGTTVDALLGAPRAVSTCPHCGASWQVKP